MKKSTEWAVLKWILAVSGPTLWWTVLLLVVRILQSAACVAYAYAFGRVVDSAQAGAREVFFKQLAFFIVLVITTLILQAFGRYLLEKSKTALEKRFKAHTFSQLLGREYARIAQTHTGEWMNRITSDALVVADAAAAIVPELTGALTRMLGAVVSLIGFAPQIALILLPGGLLMTGFSCLIRKRLKQLHKKMQQADGKARSFMQERLYSLPVVRAFTQEDSSVRMAAEHIDQYSQARMRRFRFVNISFSLFAVAVNGAQVLGIGLCGWGILTGSMTYGTMSSVLYLINLMESPIHSVSGYFAQYYSMLASAERLMEIEEFEPDTVSSPRSQETVHAYYRDELAAFGLEKVSFAYEEGEDNIVLDHFSAEIRKGEFVAFTGESGCGKSTTMKLLMNLYKIREGDVYLSGKDGTRQMLDATWRGLFAYVPQGNQLISGTIRETLAFSDKELMKQEEKIQEALRIACADGFVFELPDGLDTVLGERGSGLSEGQMQRLSVARAVLSGRPVLLLDEATSALDAATEEQLLKNLRAMTDRTVLIITHRDAALDICDRQVRFEKPHSDVL